MRVRDTGGDDPLHDAIGPTVDALLRPRTLPPPSGVLRVADLYSIPDGLGDVAREAGLEVVFHHLPGEAVGDISDQSRIPPFDLLTTNLPGGAEEEAFALTLRFLRVRRPMAFLMAGATRSDLEPEFLPLIRRQIERLGYRVDGRHQFLTGALWEGPFSWPSEPVARIVVRQVATAALVYARD